VGTPGINAQTAGQIGYLNTTVVLQQTPGFDVVDSTLAAERADFQEEADALQSELDSAMAAFDQQQLVLSPVAREERVTEIRDLNQRVQARLQEMQNHILERQRELVAPLEDRMLTVVNGIRAERGLAVVFDVANPNTTIISADPALDLTSLVISRLQGSGP
jgi:outer membrane protein